MLFKLERGRSERREVVRTSWIGRIGTFSNDKCDFQPKGVLRSLLHRKLWYPHNLPLLRFLFVLQGGWEPLSFQVTPPTWFAHLGVGSELAPRNSPGGQVLAVIGVLYFEKSLSKIVCIYQIVHLSKVTPHKWLFIFSGADDHRLLLKFLWFN